MVTRQYTKIREIRVKKRVFSVFNVYDGNVTGTFAALHKYVYAGMVYNDDRPQRRIRSTFIAGNTKDEALVKDILQVYGMSITWG